MKNSISVKINLTADEWELFTCNQKCGTAARQLNAAATKAINEAHKVYAQTRSSKDAVRAAWGIWSPVSEALSDFGASDSEPRWHFDSLLLMYFLKPLDLESNW